VPSPGESLTLPERVAAALSLGESHFREFKSALEGPPSDKRPRDPKLVRRDIGEALVAFANADGGELLVGVEDDGEVTGVPHGAKDIESFLRAWTTNVHPDTPLQPPRLTRVEFDGTLVLYFSIEKSAARIHLTSDGRCLQRRDTESVPVPTESILFERQERLSREYDREFIDGGDPSVLDLEAVARIGDDIAPGLSPEKVLQLLDLAEYSGPGVRLRRAAVLLLAKDVRHWHPRCEVRILRVAGTELSTGRSYNVISDKHINGCILDLITRSWDEIRPHLVETRLSPGGRFEEQVRYPEDACREALTNAIAHRDYSIEGRAIEVYVFDDRLEIRSPGALLSTVSIAGIKSLEGVHQSRNTVVARTLRELGYMREMGEGFRRIYQLMRAHDLVEPELAADDQSFVVSLRHESVFSDADRRWIEAYEHFELEKDEEKILLLGRSGESLSVQQIMDALGFVDTENYRALIERLQRKGLLESLPKKRNQTRASPRWKVVQPKEANEFYGELLQGVREVFDGGSLTKRELSRVAEHLSPASPYNPDALSFTLRQLRLVDGGGAPLGRLKAVLDTPQNRQERPPARVSETVPKEHSTLFIGNLPSDADPNALASLFGAFGKVLRVQIPRDYHRKDRNRGYGFITMDSEAAAEEAAAGLEGADLSGRSIRIEKAKG
jgi:ATP-dependent DNA helicase RecG